LNDIYITIILNICFAMRFVEKWNVVRGIRDTISEEIECAFVSITFLHYISIRILFLYPRPRQLFLIF